jgi:hypothetical protein
MATTADPESFHDPRFLFDLPGQNDHTEPIVVGGEKQVGLGWHGPWVTALLEKQDCSRALGGRTEIVWNYHTISEKPIATWGVKFRLKVSFRTFTAKSQVLTPSQGLGPKGHKVESRRMGRA